jgi:hypothetical protein
MSVRRPLLWGLGFVVLLGVVLGVSWRLTAAGPPRTVKLADGRTATAKSVTFGTEHRYVHAPPWLKPIARWLPEKWFKRWGVRKLYTKTDPPALVVWVQFSGRAKTAAVAMDASVFEGMGVESEPQRHKLAAYPQPTEALYGWEFANSPRRGKTIGLRLYHRDNTARPHVSGELFLSNPERRKYPDWVPEPLPVTRRQDGLEFTLLSLTTGEPVPERLKITRGHVAPWNTAAFRVTTNGEPTDAWRVASVELADASGNQFTPVHMHSTNMGSRLLFGFNSPVWSGEKVWKLVAEFSRVADFRAEELWTLKGVAVPATNSQAPVGVRTNLLGLTLAVQQLSRMVPWGITFPGQMRLNAQVQAQLLPPTRGLRLSLVGVLDDKARLLRRAPAFETPDGRQSFWVELLPDSQALDFTFAVHKSRFAEFVAAPQKFGTNSPGRWNGDR